MGPRVSTSRRRGRFRVALSSVWAGAGYYGLFVEGVFAGRVAEGDAFDFGDADATAQHLAGQAGVQGGGLGAEGRADAGDADAGGAGSGSQVPGGGVLREDVMAPAALGHRGGGADKPGQA